MYDLVNNYWWKKYMLFIMHIYLFACFILWKIDYFVSIYTLYIAQLLCAVYSIITNIHNFKHINTNDDRYHS